MRHGSRSSGVFSASWNVWIMVTIAAIVVLLGAWAFLSPTSNAAVEAVAEEEVEDVIGESEQRLEADVKVAEAIQRAHNGAKAKDVEVESESSSGLAEETGVEGAGEEDERGGNEEVGGQRGGKGGEEEEEGGGEEEEVADAGGAGKGERGGGGGKEVTEEGGEEGEVEGGGGGGKEESASEEEGGSEGAEEEEEEGGKPAPPKGMKGKKGGEGEEAAGEEGGEGAEGAEGEGEDEGGKAAGNSKFFTADPAAIEAAWDSEDAAAADPNVPAADLKTESSSSEAGSGLKSQARESEEEARLDIREAATKEQDSKQTEDDFGEVEGGAAVIPSNPGDTKPPLMAGPVGQGTGEEGGGVLPTIDLENTKFQWPSCGGNRTDWVPCLDNEKAIKSLRTNKHYEHRERHCPVPEEMEKCLVRLPEGYKAHVPWPESRDQVWYNNVPHPGLASYKKDQNWVAMQGDKLVFPGGGTQFTHGATGYINFVQKAFPDVAWGKRVRVILDMGCGVASLSAYLDQFDVRVMSMAPKDEHEAQIQLALERGVLAVVGVMGTQRLPFSSNSFDAVHCARCRVPWHIDGGMLLLELNRVLRPGGYFIWSATPVYRKKGDDEEIWSAMTDLADRMCWTLKVREKEDGLDNVGVAVWQKPSDNRCYSERGAETAPPMCESDDNPDAAWYVPMKACLHPVPAFKGVRAAQWPAMGRARLRAVPAWLQMLRRGVFGGPAVAEMKRDQIHWKKVVAFYDASFGIDWSTVRNVMDLNAHYGGFAAELAVLKKPLWVLNVVPTSGPDSLPIVFERGLVGIYHDWCEAFNSYPRSYDLLHADHTVSQEVGRCDVTFVLLEMDRMLRPEGWAIFRDHAHMEGSIRNLAASFHWRLKFNKTEAGEVLLAFQKTFWRPKEEA
ncbi:hypothetical protein CLOM_g10962 [Closterium sp. NIES-68]|nr:hypothetical protein CLOM_g10962 [Closterium sp. NIES-68]GJP86004.1 hypothetical protein CLOP_g16074 [Closterium sp. NIES-67]